MITDRTIRVKEDVERHTRGGCRGRCGRGRRVCGSGLAPAHPRALGFAIALALTLAFIALVYSPPLSVRVHAAGAPRGLGGFRKARLDQSIAESFSCCDAPVRDV